MCVTWLIQTCDMTHPHAWLDFKKTKYIRRLTFWEYLPGPISSQTPAARAGKCCGVTCRTLHGAILCSCARYIYIYIYFFECVCGMTHSVMRHDLFRCAIGWEIVWCDDSAMSRVEYGGALLCIRASSIFWCILNMCVTCLIQTCDMTHPHVWHDLFRCAIGWLRLLGSLKL